MLAETVILAMAETVKAVANLVATIAATQTAEQQKQMWDWYIADMERWRKLWGLE